MHTKLCGACYTTIHAAAEICPRCGGRQMPWLRLMQQPRQYPSGTLWLPVPALIVAITTLLLAFGILAGDDWGDLSRKDAIETIAGLASFVAIAVALGIASLASQQRGQGMAIAAIVISLLSMLFMAGWIAG